MPVVSAGPWRLAGLLGAAVLLAAAVATAAPRRSGPRWSAASCCWRRLRGDGAVRAADGGDAAHGPAPARRGDRRRGRARSGAAVHGRVPAVLPARRARAGRGSRTCWVAARGCSPSAGGIGAIVLGLAALGPDRAALALGVPRAALPAALRPRVVRPPAARRASRSASTARHVLRAVRLRARACSRARPSVLGGAGLVMRYAVTMALPFVRRRCSRPRSTGDARRAAAEGKPASTRATGAALVVVGSSSWARRSWGGSA